MNLTLGRRPDTVRANLDFAIRWQDAPAPQFFLCMADAYRLGWPGACLRSAPLLRRRSSTITAGTNSFKDWHIHFGSSRSVPSWAWTGIRPASRPALLAP